MEFVNENWLLMEQFIETASQEDLLAAIQYASYLMKHIKNKNEDKKSEESEEATTLFIDSGTDVKWILDHLNLAELIEIRKKMHTALQRNNLDEVEMGTNENISNSFLLPKGFVHLKNWTIDLETSVLWAVSILEELKESDYMVFYDLVRKSRDSKYEIAPDILERLKKWWLLDPVWNIQELLSNTALAAVEWDWVEMHLVDPIWKQVEQDIKNNRPNINQKKRFLEWLPEDREQEEE